MFARNVRKINTRDRVAVDCRRKVEFIAFNLSARELKIFHRQFFLKYVHLRRIPLVGISRLACTRNGIPKRYDVCIKLIRNICWQSFLLQISDPSNYRFRKLKTRISSPEFSSQLFTCVIMRPYLQRYTLANSYLSLLSVVVQNFIIFFRDYRLQLCAPAPCYRVYNVYPFQLIVSNSARACERNLFFTPGIGFMNIPKSRSRSSVVEPALSSELFSPFFPS